MSRYRGRQGAKSVEQDFPHFVEIAVPPNGLGNTLVAMYDFHARYRIVAKRGHGRHDDGASFIRWCFADPAVAAAFASEFNASVKRPAGATMRCSAASAQCCRCSPLSRPVLKHLNIA